MAWGVVSEPEPGQVAAVSVSKKRGAGGHGGEIRHALVASTIER